MYPWLKIVENKNSSKTVDIFMYGEITDEKWRDSDVSLYEFKDIQNIKADTINIYLNSPGGNVFAGISIGSILKRHDAFVNIVVDGVAGSIAATILMSGDKKSIVNNGMVYMHNPMTFAFGYASDFRKIANDLDIAKESILSEFIDKTGQTKEIISKIMDNETYLTAQKALELGFVDEIIEDKKATGTATENKLIINGVDFKNSKINEYINYNPEKITLENEVIAEPDYSNIEQVILENKILLNKMEVLA